MRDAFDMRTTLNLDDDVIETARALAAQKGQSLGEAVSDLIRRGVQPAARVPTKRNGISLFPVAVGARRVTPEIVAALLDETP
jgi:hypothetical protein